MNDRLELRRQHVVLLVVEVELCHPLGHREAIKPLQQVDPKQRVIRCRQRLIDALDELIPASLGDGVALHDGTFAALVPHKPSCDVCVGTEVDGQAGSGDLRPGVGLMPVHPAAAVLDVDAVPGSCPGAAADAIAGFQ